jgi:trimethylamine--corrinoid protein Co-methyltransferase
MKTTQLKVLDENEIQQIHQGTLTVLEKTGIYVNEEQARKILKEHGAKVDDSKKHVWIPPSLLEDGIKKAPREFTIHARDPKLTLKIDCEKIYFEPMVGRLNILDSSTWKRRRTTLKDLENLMKIANAMPNFNLLHSGAMMPHIEGVPDPVAHVYGYFTAVKNAQKVVKGTGRGTSKAQDCIRMAAVLAGGMDKLKKETWLFTTGNTVSPLQLDKPQVEGIIEYARANQAVDITAEVQSGATSPVTFAGSLVVQNCEVLTGILISQLTKAGAPVFYGTCGGVMDMRLADIALGGVESGLINIASAQLAHHYHIPCRGTAATTESKALDMQAGYEKAVTLLMAAMGGANTIFYPGVMDHALTISLESYVIDNEICGMVNRALKGMVVDQAHLALDIIDKVGPMGHFLGQKHTMQFLKDEHYFPTISDRRIREEWEKDGSKELKEVAKERVQQILKEHIPLEVEPDKLKQLTQIVKEVEKREGVYCPP